MKQRNDRLQICNDLDLGPVWVNNLFPGAKKPHLCYIVIDQCRLYIVLSNNLCRATSGGYINFGCSREVHMLFLRGYFQWSMSLRGGGGEKFL